VIQIKSQEKGSRLTRLFSFFSILLKFLLTYFCCTLSNLNSNRKIFLIFICVGTLNTLISFVFFAFISKISLNIFLALISSTTYTIVSNYFLTKKIVFKKQGQFEIITLIKFTLLYLVLFFTNFLLIKLIVSLGLGKNIAWLISAVPIAIISFISIKKIFS